MERDIDNIIRVKIHQLDEQPVRWRKDEVWQTLNKHKTTRSLRRPLLAIAASLTFITILTAYLYFRSDSESRKKQIAALEKADVQTLKQKDPDKVPNQVEICIDTISNDELTQDIAVKKTRSHKPPVTALRIDTVVVARQEPKLPTNPSLPDTATFDNTLATESPIEPIIGVVTSDEKVVRVEKRRKIKIMRGIEPFYNGKNYAATPVLARIK